VFDGGRGPTSGPDGADGVARVAPGMEDLVLEAAEACPGDCI
jgi:ferredoxin